MFFESVVALDLVVYVCMHMPWRVSCESLGLWKNLREIHGFGSTVEGVLYRVWNKVWHTR